MVFRHIVFALMVQGALLATPAAAFELKPKTDLDKQIEVLTEEKLLRKLWGSSARSAVAHFSSDVHERITNLAWQCDPALGCPDSDAQAGVPSSLAGAPAAVLAGVRWNDNPPFKLAQTSTRCKGRTIALPNYSECWFKVFLDGKERARKEYLDKASGVVIMLRSHFGDLQFLHAMASKKDEAAEETVAKIMLWSEFTWRTASREFTRGTRIDETGIAGLKDYFKPWETVQTLFIPDDPTHQQKIHEVAFGSLLHTVEDSFSRSHAERSVAAGTSCGSGLGDQPGRLERFYNYALQNSSEHSVEDKASALQLHRVVNAPDVVDVVANLRVLYQRGATWDEAKPYVSCIFGLGERALAAAPATQAGRH